jgi:hypothetical protein
MPGPGGQGLVLGRMGVGLLRDGAGARVATGASAMLGAMAAGRAGWTGAAWAKSKALVRSLQTARRQGLMLGSATPKRAP